jgi:hypothetical protein
MPSSPDTPAASRPRAPVLGSFLEGWRRVLRAPALVGVALAATFVLALPLGLVLQHALADHLGSSLEAGRAADGWNAGWAVEYQTQAQGMGRTFTYEFLGFGGTLAIVNRVVDGGPLPAELMGAIAVSIAVWVFLSGGILDRLARGRRVGTGQFFAACGVYFVRFLRLAIVIGAAYWALFRWLHPFLFERVFHHFTRDMTSERSGAVLRIGLYVAFLLAVAAVNVVADFAKVRAVVEDRRSMASAIGAALRFIRRRPLRVLVLYLLNAVAFAAILRMWMVVAPGAAAPAWWAFVVTEVYLLVRVWARLAFMASEIVFVQGELAHAHYTALPARVWPDSPAAEAIDNMARRDRA